jgi:hypothetical protein
MDTNEQAQFDSICVRLGRELRGKLNRHVAARRERAPSDAKISIGSVVRDLIERGLDEAQK